MPRCGWEIRGTALGRGNACPRDDASFSRTAVGLFPERVRQSGKNTSRIHPLSPSLSIDRDCVSPRDLRQRVPLNVIPKAASVSRRELAIFSGAGNFCLACFESKKLSPVSLQQQILRSFPLLLLLFYRLDSCATLFVFVDTYIRPIEFSPGSYVLLRSTAVLR